MCRCSPLLTTLMRRSGFPCNEVIALVTLGRAVAIYPVCAVFARSSLKVDMCHQHILFWGGLRGALALALAFGAARGVAPARCHRHADLCGGGILRIRSRADHHPRCCAAWDRSSSAAPLSADAAVLATASANVSSGDNGHLAAGETEATDPGAPVETARGLQVLVRIIKGAIIAGVDRYSTVVAPSMQAARLRPTAGLE